MDNTTYDFICSECGLNKRGMDEQIFECPECGGIPGVLGAVTTISDFYGNKDND